MEKQEYSGVLFINKNKTNDKSPDYFGSIFADGKDVNIIGWDRKSDKGCKYIRILKAKDRFAEPEQPIKDEVIGVDNIPFEI